MHKFLVKKKKKKIPEHEIFNEICARMIENL